MKKLFTLFVIFLLTGNISAQWSEQTSGVSSLLFSVSAVDDNVVWACGAGGVVLRTINSGIVWTQTASPNSSLDFHCIQGIDAMTALVGGSDVDGYAYKTIDGGATWTLVFFQTDGFVDNIKALNGFPGRYVLQGDPVGGRWTIFFSNDYGDTWDSAGFYHAATSSEAGWNNSLSVTYPATHFWFGTNNTKIVQVSLSGTFTDRSTVGLPNSYSVCSNDNNRLMSGGDGSNVLYSNDQGASWTDVGGPGIGEIGGFVGGRNTSKWYYSSGNSVFYSSDNGATWNLVYTTGGYYFHMSLSPVGGCMWAVRDNGGISRYCFDTPLPVELTSFSHSVVNNNVNLSWITSSETNNSHFEIERSPANGWSENRWSTIGNVRGNGTVSAPSQYSFTDAGVNPGKYNYRLKQVDFNGNYNYYYLQGDVIVGSPDKFSLSQNYPNPFNPVTKINFEIPFEGKVLLKVYDISGKEVSTLINDNKTAGFHSVNFNATKLASGVYIYRLTALSDGKNYSAEKKMVLMK